MDKFSARAQQMNQTTVPALLDYISLLSNQYDAETNPNGVCNMSVAENQLCEKEIVEKLQSSVTWKASFNYYPIEMGQISLRQALCGFFEDVFHLDDKLDPDRMLITSGLASAISIISYLVADPNDAFLIASPYYTMFDHDISVHSNNVLVRCPLLEQDTGKFRFCVEIFKNGYEKALNNGLRPRGIIIANPNNPVGDVYDEKTIQSILEFAAEKQLHVIVDEIYALSQFNDQKSFKSIFNYVALPDPIRTHFLWSFSKDFALSGTRVGVIYCSSRESCITGVAVNLMVPSIVVQETLAKLLADRQWTRWYIELNRSRLTAQYQRVKQKLEAIDNRIRVRETQAGFFLWVDFRLLLHEVTFEEENRLRGIVLNKGVAISTGFSMGCSQPGWFRIIFSLKDSCIEKGLHRLKIALDTYEHEK